MPTVDRLLRSFVIRSRTYRVVRSAKATMMSVPARLPANPTRQACRVPGKSVGDRTGPLELLNGRDVLAVFDIENLSIGAAQRGLQLDYGALLARLTRAARQCEAHACFSRRPRDLRGDLYFAQQGLISHPRDIEFVATVEGKRSLANSDARLLFETGRLMASHHGDTLLLATGDGDLGCELARAVHADFGPHRWTVVTLSLAGSSSHRLNAASNPDIFANLAIGGDVLDTLNCRWIPGCGPVSGDSGEARPGKRRRGMSLDRDL